MIPFKNVYVIFQATNKIIMCVTVILLIVWRNSTAWQYKYAYLL